MKNIKVLTFATALFLTIGNIHAQVRSADSMIHKIFATLKAKDQKAFVALYPNGQQFSKMMRTMMNQMMNTEQVRQQMAADEKTKNMNVDSLIDAEIAKFNKPEVFAEMEKSFANSFQKVIEKGEKKGVNWSDVQLITYTMDTTSKLDDEMDVLNNIGFKAMKGVIDFRSANTDYQMSFDKVMYLPDEGGWFGGEFPQVAKKGESLQPDVEIEEMTQVDSVKVVEPKQKVKTKTKTPGSKTKTKTKTPARKPNTKS